MDAASIEGMVVDLFAGGGGVSTGLRAALKRKVNIALNHWRTAILVHKRNHPDTHHLTEDAWKVDPVVLTEGEEVLLLWASPDCRFHSIARGGKPRDQKIRVLPYSIVRWADKVKPRVIMVENVPEFVHWGPLGPDKKPIKSRRGESFAAWTQKLRRLGYQVEHRVLNAADFGAPTRRRRLFVVARRDGQPICWPQSTHGPGLEPYHTAAECIDWSRPCRSIFTRKKPLAEKTQRRIAMGIRKFVLENPRPFIISFDQQSTGDTSAAVTTPVSSITTKARHAVVAPSLVKVNHGGKRKLEARGEQIDLPLSTVTAGRLGHALVAPTLIQTGYGERPGQRPRYLDLHQPLGTMVDGQKHALVAAFLAKHYGDPDREEGGGRVIGTDLREPIGAVTSRDHHSLAAATLVKLRGTCSGADVAEPMPTLSAQGTHVAEVRAFLTTYYSQDGTGGQELFEPMRTLTAKHRLGLVTIHGVNYQIVDIRMRMLHWTELLRAQMGKYAEGYDLSDAKTSAAKVKLIGNMVPPELVEALVRANFPEATQRQAA